MTGEPARARSRLAVGIIGVGRAGSALGMALEAAGHRVIAVHARGPDSLGRAATFFPDADVASVDDVMACGDLVLLTVPDDDLPPLIDGIAADGPSRPGQFLVHASGRYGPEILAGLAAAGAVPIALHPAMTLTGTTSDLKRLSGCPFAVTAPSAVRPIAEALVVEMGGEPLWVPEGARVRYHAALSHAANHLVTLIADSLDLLAEAGIEEPSRLLEPLTTAALDNVLRSGDAALTGPVSRGDAGTLQAHLEVLHQSPVGPSYLAMARRTADRALAAGRLAPTAGVRLLALLADGADRGRPGA